MGGSFTINRGLWEDPDFAPEPFTEREAWMWLIGAAAWREHRVRGAHGPVALERGEFVFSVRFLAARWKWSKDATQRFIKKLQNRDMIRDAGRDSERVYLIKNYNEYQLGGDDDRDTDEDSNRTKLATEPGHQTRREPDTDRDTNRDKEEPLNHSTIKTLFSPTKFVLPEWVPAEAWEAFAKMRGKRFTAKARDLNLRTLERLRDEGHDPRAVLERTIEMGWTGLFPIKNDGDRNGKRPNGSGKSNAVDRSIRVLAEIAGVGSSGDREPGNREETGDAGRVRDQMLVGPTAVQDRAGSDAGAGQRTLGKADPALLATGHDGRADAFEIPRFLLRSKGCDGERDGDGVCSV